MNSRYINENDVYTLVEPRGLAKVHVTQIDELPRADVVPRRLYEELLKPPEPFPSESEIIEKLLDEIYRRLPTNKQFNNCDIQLGYAWAMTAVQRLLNEIREERLQDAK